MPGINGLHSNICTRCLRVESDALRYKLGYGVRHASNSGSPKTSGKDDKQPSRPREEQKGAMSRRLEELSDKSIETGGRNAVKAIEEAGFSEELKKQLEEKIAGASFRNEHAGAFAQTNMSSTAGKDTRDIAGARPWMGTESVADASLRMLNDAHKPMRGPVKIPSVRTAPRKVDTGRPATKTGTGTRIANARDRTSAYSFMKDVGMSEEEKEKFRQQMKHRFQAGAREVPATIQGLAALANERIEDAIARGQFKNLPRGKKIENDHNANSPFIDTTEYFMNKIIQRQDIVPPWIEKQQELVSTASRFRSRLRADWKRHVSRIISSRGGSLEKQITLAEEYAYAESLENPPRKKMEQLNAIDERGYVSQITLAGELKAAPQPTSSDDAIEDAAKAEEEIKIMEQTFNDDGTLKPPEEQVILTASQPEASPHPVPGAQRRVPTVQPFRDPQWEQTERSYLNLAIENLNSLTRSYNLMAPQIARKPYFYLSRELKACFAEVAPQVASAIRERALTPKLKGVEVVGHKPGGVLEKFSTETTAKVWDERKPQYGFKEFWRDLLAGGPKT